MSDYGQLEATAREFARRFAGTAGEDVENITQALGQGAGKLQDVVRQCVPYLPLALQLLTAGPGICGSGGGRGSGRDGDDGDGGGDDCGDGEWMDRLVFARQFASWAAFACPSSCFLLHCDCIPRTRDVP